MSIPNSAIATALVGAYGFVLRPDNTLYWGQGSICNGQTVTIAFHGERVTVKHKTFFCNGEVEADTCSETECYAAQVWAHLPASVFKQAVRQAQRRERRRA